MKRLIGAVLSLAVIGLMLAPQSFAAYGGGNGSSDPCSYGVKHTVPVAITTATTTAIVPLATNAAISVCGLQLSAVGGTAVWEYGTGAACTSPTAITGAQAAGSTQSVFPGGVSVLAATPVSNDLCVLSGSGATAVNGWITYVQQ